MRFHFTAEDRPTQVRGGDLRAALAHAGHRVSGTESFTPAPAGTDIWLHGLGIEGSPSMSSRMEAALLASSAKIFVFQLCDGASLSFDAVPESLRERAHLFLRNHWPSDRSSIPVYAIGRTAWMPPMMKDLAPKPGRLLRDRTVRTSFYGTRTGMSNLPGGGNARDALVKSMRSSGIPFCGGLVFNSDPRYPVLPELASARISHRAHARLLSDLRICLAPWGNHPITYRFFEGLSRRCLVVAQSLESTTFLDGGLEPGRHYVQVAADLGDLVDKVRYYLAHEDEAQRIADAGHEHFERHFAPRGGLISKYLFDATVASWGDVYLGGEARWRDAIRRIASALTSL